MHSVTTESHITQSTDFTCASALLTVATISSKVISLEIHKPHDIRNISFFHPGSTNLRGSMLMPELHSRFVMSSYDATGSPTSASQTSK